MKITNIQLAFTGLEAADLGQQSIEGFLKAEPKEQKHSGIDYDGATSILNPHVEDPSDKHSLTATSFICPRCTKCISLPETSNHSDDARATEMATLKLEHDDFHFAQDLARTPGQGLKRLRPDGPSPKRKKQGREDEEAQGIARFFNRR
jgi:DNA polymerase eta